MKIDYKTLEKITLRNVKLAKMLIDLNTNKKDTNAYNEIKKCIILLREYPENDILDSEIPLNKNGYLDFGKKTKSKWLNVGIDKITIYTRFWKNNWLNKQYLVLNEGKKQIYSFSENELITKYFVITDGKKVVLRRDQFYNLTKIFNYKINDKYKNEKLENINLEGQNNE